MKLCIVACLAVLLLPAVACNQQSSPPAAAPVTALPVAPVATVAPVAPVTAAPAPLVDPNAVAELPDYPGATVAAYSAKGAHEGWSRSVERKLASTATYAEVKAFYQAAITQNGWTVTGVKEEADEVEWKLAKGTSVGEVKVDNEGPLKGIEIRLERKDR